MYELHAFVRSNDKFMSNRNNKLPSAKEVLCDFTNVLSAYSPNTDRRNHFNICIFQPNDSSIDLILNNISLNYKVECRCILQHDTLLALSPVKLF